MHNGIYYIMDEGAFIEIQVCTFFSQVLKEYIGHMLCDLMLCSAHALCFLFVKGVCGEVHQIIFFSIILQLNWDFYHFSPFIKCMLIHYKVYHINAATCIAIGVPKRRAVIFAIRWHYLCINIFHFSPTLSNFPPWFITRVLATLTVPLQEHHMQERRTFSLACFFLNTNKSTFSNFLFSFFSSLILTRTCTIKPQDSLNRGRGSVRVSAGVFDAYRSHMHNQRPLFSAESNHEGRVWEGAWNDLYCCLF